MRATPDHIEEQAILGAAILDPSSLDRVGSTLSPADFADRNLGAVFAVMVAMRAAGRSVGDSAVLMAALRDARLLDRLGGPAVIGRWAIACEGPYRADEYAQIIRTASRRRRLQRISTELAARASDTTDDPDNAIAWLESELSACRGASITPARPLPEICRDVLHRADDAAIDDKPTSLKTDITSLNNFLSLRAGDCCIVAARPSAGKTVLVSQIARHNAEQGSRVLMVSLEMDSASLGVRHLSSQTGVSPSRIIDRLYTPVTRGELRDAADDAPATYAVWHGRSVKVGTIRSLAKLHKATGGIDLLVIDYLGLIAPDDSRRQRWDYISEISRSLKSLAIELEIPIVVACQLGRDAEGQEPHLGHLRDSGAIEQDADQVLLLSRTRGDSKTLVQVAKNRNGAIGRAELFFDDLRLLFRDADDSGDVPPHKEFMEYAK